MSYTFDLLGPDFSAAYLRKCITAFETAVTDGWICWAFSNHDVIRHVTRWTKPGGSPEATAKFAVALLACLRGSICIYQGEELGLEEAELAFDDLRDPYGIRFWPGYKGRDGCRTPMPWDERRPRRRLYERKAVAAGSGCAARAGGGQAGARPRFGACPLPRGAGVPASGAVAGQRLDRACRCAAGRAHFRARVGK